MAKKLLALLFALIMLFSFTGVAVAESDSTFTVHFIDVGQADAALLLCDSEAMLIDGGNAEDSSLIYAYLKKLGISHLEYIVCTHAHEDHVGGLAGALNYASVDNVLCPVEDYDSRAFQSFVKYLGKQKVGITLPTVGDSFSFGSATVNILGPITQSDEPNNTSIVLQIVYGDTSFLFTGDAEREEEQDILDAGRPLSSTVLKVGHHGSDSSTTYPFLREIMPQYAVISVGADNSYGHPTDDTLSRLRDVGAEVFRTDMQGTIICVSDGKKVTFTTEKNGDADTLAAVGQKNKQGADSEDTDDMEYILNTNTRKFHYPTCSSVDQMKDKNKKDYYGDRADLINQGYSPCGRCKP